MLTSFAVFIALAMQMAIPSQPPQILQIYRQPPEAKARIEESRRWFNGYNSTAEQKRVVDDYTKNTRLLAALKKNSQRKKSYWREPRGLRKLSSAPDWILGQGRFRVITVVKDNRRINGTVFEGHRRDAVRGDGGSDSQGSRHGGSGCRS
jgi:hypothetical protein